MSSNFNDPSDPNRQLPVIYDFCLMTDDDVYLFNEGSHFRLYEKLGAHPMEIEGTAGVHFAVWAPNAGEVSVIGDFNDWNKESHRLQPLRSSGLLVKKRSSRQRKSNWMAISLLRRKRLLRKFPAPRERRGRIWKKFTPYFARKVHM